MSAIQTGSRVVSRDELTKILDEHRAWRSSGGSSGARAYLAGAYLTDADLTRANPTRAYRRRGLDRRGPDPREPDPRVPGRRVDLTRANLTRAYLAGGGPWNSREPGPARTWPART